MTVFLWASVSSPNERTTTAIEQIAAEPTRLQGTFVCQYPGSVRVEVFCLDLQTSSSVLIARRDIMVISAVVPEHERALQRDASTAPGDAAKATENSNRQGPRDGAQNGPWDEPTMVPDHAHLNSASEPPPGPLQPCAGSDLAYPAGRWLGPSAPTQRPGGHATLRSGWTFWLQDCFIPRVHLASSNRWIMVLGTSVDRGVFLSLVDQLLPSVRKKHFADSEMQKCWGYYDVSAGGLRLTYQDFRIHSEFLSTASTGFVCNGDTILSPDTKMLAHNATTFLRDYVFRQNAGRWPDVIYSNSLKLWQTPLPNATLHSLALATAERVRPILSLIPKSWSGRWVINTLESTLRCPPVLTNAMLSESVLATIANDPQRSSRRDNFEHILRAAQHQMKAIDERIQLTTTWPMYKAKLDETETGSKDLLGSLHHHKLCGKPGAEVRVCSDVTEFLSLLLLHIADTVPRSSGRPNLSGGVIGGSGFASSQLPPDRSLQLCADCPESIVPVHIRPVPEPSCTTTSVLPRDTTTHHVWPTSGSAVCPRWCMETIPPRNKPTQHGIVEELYCHTSITDNADKEMENDISGQWEDAT